jgi:hypothetical protein
MTRPHKDATASASPSVTTRALTADATLGVIRADEVYSLREFARRFRWGEHALRQARAAGLRTATFGREKFVLGTDVLSFFHQLAERQTAVAQDARASNGEGTP